MMKTIRVLVLIAILGSAVLLATGCSGRGETARSEKPAVAVETATVNRSGLDESVGVVGTLAAKFSADLKSEVTAVVEQVYVTEWVPVKKGTVLARLDAREDEANAEGFRAAVLQAEVAETRARRELDRAEKLKGAGLLTQQALDDARSALEAAEATTRAARAQLAASEARLEKTVIRAPMDGVIAYRGVSAGDRVESMGGGPMFRIVDTSLFDLTVTVPSADIHEVAAGQPLSFTTDALPGHVFEGKVAFINPAAEGASRAVMVVAEVPNRGGLLKAGLFCKGRIVTVSREAVLQVSKAALLSWDVAAGKAELFRVEEGVARRVSIRTGIVSGDRVEVLEGLAEGETVATRGAFNLRDGDRVRVIEPEA
jgi:RND family efflux transporter MFP subunit